MSYGSMTKRVMLAVVFAVGGYACGNLLSGPLSGRPADAGPEVGRPEGAGGSTLSGVPIRGGGERAQPLDPVGASGRSAELGLLRPVPIKLLKLGSIPTYGNDYAIDEEFASVFGIGPAEATEVSAALREATLAVRDRMLRNMKVVNPGDENGRYEIAIEPVRGGDVMAGLDRRLVEILGYPRARQLRVALDKRLSRSTAYFGSFGQRVVIERSEEQMAITRHLIDPETGEKVQSVGGGIWSLEDDAEVKALPPDGVKMAFTRPLLEKVELWPKR